MTVASGRPKPRAAPSVAGAQPLGGRIGAGAGVQAPAPRSFGQHLREWRLRRRHSQLGLALQAGVSTRHLSWLERGKAEPSRAMVLRLCEALDIPLRERNSLLRAAGFAALYGERPLGDVRMAPVLAALQQVLDAHEPSPALAVDGRWQMVAANRMVPMLLQRVSPALLVAPVNVLKIALHPDGLAPWIGDLPRWRAHMLDRLQRQAAASGDGALHHLLDDLRALPGAGAAHGPDNDGAGDVADERPVALPLVLHLPEGRLSFISMVSVFGAPHDIAVSELAIEAFLPADAQTAARLRDAHAALPPHAG